MKNELLVRLLARQDAAFLPCRSWFNDQRFANAVQDRRRAHFTTGTPWRTGERNEALRKHTERELQAMEKDGLAQIHRREGRILGVRLGDEAEQRIRSEIGFAPLGETLRLVRELAAMIQGGRCWGGLWVREGDLAGVSPDYADGWQEKVSDLEYDLLPAPVRGWVVSGTIVEGNAYYRLDRPVDCKPLRGLPEADREAGLLYSEALAAEIEILRRTKPEHQIG